MQVYRLQLPQQDTELRLYYGFGYGLTYTDFILSDFKLSTEKMTSKQLEQYPLSISFNIKNIGSIKSFAVPQIYISDKSASVVPRVRELKAFDKIEVEPNQTVRCELQLIILVFADQKPYDLL